MYEYMNLFFLSSIRIMILKNTFIFIFYLSLHPSIHLCIFISTILDGPIGSMKGIFNLNFTGLLDHDRTPLPRNKRQLARGSDASSGKAGLQLGSLGLMTKADEIKQLTQGGVRFCGV